MKPALARALLAAATRQPAPLVPRPTFSRHQRIAAAVNLVTAAMGMARQRQRYAWWTWTVYLFGAISVERIKRDA